jgi:hypothetical protein
MELADSSSLMVTEHNISSLLFLNHNRTIFVSQCLWLGLMEPLNE